MKVSPYKYHWAFVFGPIGNYGRELKRYGFWRVSSAENMPTFNGKTPRWFMPCGKRKAKDLRKAFPVFAGKFVHLTDAQWGRGKPGSPCKFTAQQIREAS